MRGHDARIRSEWRFSLLRRYEPKLHSQISILHSLFSMLRSPLHTLSVCLLLLAACMPATPSPTPTPVLTPTPTLTPSPTPIPSPTPTATPIPPMELAIRWPEQVSALQPVPVEVDLMPPPGVDASPAVTALVLDPQWHVWGIFHLEHRGENRYAAGEPLQLPLEPLEGDWRLAVSVQSELAVAGERRLVFRPAVIPFRDLAGVMPAGVDLRVPQQFMEGAAQGDPLAGGRVWRYGDGELAVWWAPGPTESLLLNNAVVMLEATHDPENPPTVRGVEETAWRGQAAFRFDEDWPMDASGTDGGPAEALVIQGPDFHLYVLRVRALGRKTIPSLLYQVRDTFVFLES